MDIGSPVKRHHVIPLDVPMKPDPAEPPAPLPEPVPEREKEDA